VRRLDLADLPVLAAPMAGGPTTPASVAAAAAAGSLGFLPAGYRTAAQLAADLQELRALTPAFGVNLFVPDRRPVDRPAVAAYRDTIAAELARLGVEPGPERWEDDDDWPAKVELLVDQPVPWVSFTFGLPEAAAVDALRSAGSRLLVTVTDVEEARAAAELAPDGLVVQSAAAGGHRGTFDQRRRPGEEPLGELVAGVRAATGLPVVAAGGVGGPGDVGAALAAGAEAVAVGTALLLADEAGTRPVHRAAVADPTASTATMRAYTGRVARGVTTAFSARYDPVAPAGYPAIHHLTAPMRRWAGESGDREHLHLWAGTGHRSARPGPAGELLTALVP
jgi:NAD(P)H-dependent flavin oxidoreductase YrpB (nitropropane dioxygenase family)